MGWEASWGWAFGREAWEPGWPVKGEETVGKDSEVGYPAAFQQREDMTMAGVSSRI